MLTRAATRVVPQSDLLPPPPQPSYPLSYPTIQSQPNNILPAEIGRHGPLLNSPASSDASSPVSIRTSALSSPFIQNDIHTYYNSAAVSDSPNVQNASPSIALSHLRLRTPTLKPLPLSLPPAPRLSATRPPQSKPSISTLRASYTRMLKRKSSSTAADRSMPPPPSPASQSVTHTSAPMVNTFVELDSLIQQAYISPEVPSGDPVGFGFNTGSYAADAVSSGGVGGPVDPDMESLLNLWTSPSTAYLQPLPPTPSSAVLSSTSPQLYQASPYQDILQTPASLPPSLFGTSPDIVSASPSQPSPALRLFDDIDISTESTWSQLMSIIPTAADAVSAAASTSKSAQKTPAHIGLGLHTSMSRDQSWEPASSSSASLSVSPQSLSSRPLATSTSPPHVDSPQTESQRVTGVRKNIKPTDLIPFDAPIQPRNYITPSVTSRKEIPPSVARTFVPNSSRKRSSTSAGLPSAEEMHDELADEDPAAAAEALRRREMDPEKAALLEHVEAARRRNTLAARKSRQRKLEHVRNLEELVERLQRENEELQKHKEENEQLRKRVELLEAQVEQLGGVPARLA